MSSKTGRSLRVRPRIWIAVAIYIAYVAAVFGVQLITGVSYDEFGESGENLFLGAGLSLIVGAILLAVATTLLGWWRPALFDRHRSEHVGLIVAPAIMAVALSTFADTHRTSGPLAALAGVLEIVAFALALISVAFVIRVADAHRARDDGLVSGERVPG